MLFSRSGFPKESEIVLCTVTKIQHHSVFVRLDWYDKQGMLHISEISPGRIRNIREFIEEGKTVVCKVLSVDQTKGHIDVSLRRVGDHQRSELLDQLKQEMKSEKILEVFCHEKKTDVKVTYAAIMPQVQKTYLFLHQAFSAVMQGSYDIAQLGLPKQETESLKTLILQRIKPPQVEIIGKFKIISFANNGIELIRETLTKAANVSKNLSLVYGGGGYYNMKITGADFKDAEKVLSDILSIIEPVFKEAKEAQYEFVRSEGKQVS